MKSINSLLNQPEGSVSQILKREPTGTTSPNFSAKHRMTVANIWQVLLSRRLVNSPVGSDAYKVFEADTADLSEAQLRHGMEAAKDFTGFFTFPTFRELCRPDAKALGLPEAKQAYIEACNKPLPWERQKWTHAAVYLAAREAGRFELHTLTERDAFPLFRANYETMCKRVMNGDNLEVPVQRMLPESVPQPVSREEGKARCAALKEMLA